ncbi:MAG: thiamine-phosphate kinase [Pirellulales bacterium]|nr:thiamine-phosphate kinase [Pirellulales bacterium]
MEQRFVDWLRRHVPPVPPPAIGIGDDAAVLPWRAGGDIVLTTDTITDKVDFVLAETEPRLIGHKALGVNLSDLAAMAATPVAALASVVLPRAVSGGGDPCALAMEIYSGMLALAEQFQVALVGGDTNSWEGSLVISVTAIGRVTSRGPLTRSGALPGDRVLVTGRLGGSLLGRHLAVEPRVREAVLLAERYELHAGLDISDGLALDASRLAGASGCGIALELAAIPISAAAEQLARQTGKSPLEHALGDGEDFELLFTAPPDAAEQIVRDQPLSISVTDVGQCIGTPGLWQVGDSGALNPLAPTGYQH